MKIYHHFSFFIMSVLVIAAVLGLSKAYTQASDAPEIVPIFPLSGSNIDESQWSNFSVSWGTATLCEYSYDGESYNSVDCQNTEVIPAPGSEGPVTLYYRATNDGGTTNNSVSFSYTLLQRHTVTYQVTSHGTISGSSVQTIIDGGETSPVTVVADPGYHFSKWSDDSYRNPRQDSKVTSDFTVTALIELGSSTVTVDSETGVEDTALYLPYTIQYDGSAAFPVQLSIDFSKDDLSYNYSTIADLSISTGGSYSSSLFIKNLTCGTTYNYRPAILDSMGNKSYGEPKQFTTGGCRLPVFGSTNFVTGETATDLAVSVNIQDPGSSIVTKLSMLYGLSTEYGTTREIIDPEGYGLTGDQTFRITGLTCGKQYHFKFVAENNYGETSLDDVTYIVSCSDHSNNARPTVVTKDPTDVTKNSVTLVGEVRDVGGEPGVSKINVRGFLYLKASALGQGEPAPEDIHQVREEGEYEAGVFTAAVTNLECETEYVYIAIAQNNEPDSDSTYGEPIKLFTTGSCSETSGGGGGSGGQGQQSQNGTIAIAPSFLIPTLTGVSGGAGGDYAGCIENTNFSPLTGKKCPPSIIGDAIFEFTKFLSFGSYDEQVRQLQRFLNSHGFPVAASGPGSKGYEIPVFGSRTMRALSLYQRMNKIAPASGYLGPKTLEFINEVMRKEYEAVKGK